MSDSLLFENQTIIPIDIEAEMKKSFLEYSMSVIVDRALPDVRDGLKPVHRRILYSMFTQGFTPDKAYRKCATTVGDVLGRFHPHGDAAVYDTMVRMAQDWSLRHTLVDGHGNFGSMDGDAAAAYRYTEARLTKISLEMLADINKDTVDFKPNFDEHEMEPVVLPSRFPNLLVNGSTGIAVGMATNIPPHNLGEVIDGINLVIDNPEATVEELMEVIKGPDFPTAATIMGKSGIREYFRTGKGRCIVRAEVNIEELKNGRNRIIVTELPYQVNKARLVEKIAELVKEKRIEGIADLKDESGREEPVRIVIDLKKDANANVVLNQLYKHTQLQDSFCANMVAIVQTPEGKYEPKVINLKQAIDYYISHQKDVIVRRTRFDLKKAEDRAHILEGLKIAIDNIDEVIRIIRASATEDAAKAGLMEAFALTDRQAQAIVDMRLGRLSGLERDKIENEYQSLLAKIEYFRAVIASDDMQFEIIKNELGEIKNKFANPRRTKIGASILGIEDEDLIPEEQTVITLTHRGYVKRLPVDTYKSQHRGGKGITGLTTREEDFVETIFTTSTHDYIMFLTNLGRAYRLKGYEIPESGRTAKGMAIVNLLQLEAGERIQAVFPIDRELNSGEHYLIMATKNGIVKKTILTEYDSIRKGGKYAVTLRDGDELVNVKLTDGDTDLMVVTKNGQSILFNEKDVRATGRTSTGVKGITLRDGDEVIGMDTVQEGKQLLCISENGYGKRTEVAEYRNQSRGGKGIMTYKITEKTGCIVGMAMVSDEEDLLLISSDGTIIRLHVDEISILGRTTQGVRCMRMPEDVTVVSIEPTERYEEDEVVEAGEETKSSAQE